MTRSDTTNKSTADEMEWSLGHTRPAAEQGHAGHDAAAYAVLPEDEGNEAAFNLDWRRFVIGAWQRRYIGLATTAAIVFLSLVLISVGVSRYWQSSVTLIKRSHQDRLSLAERDPFKTQDYSLATLLDTLKLPSSLEAVRREADLNVNLTTLASAIDVSLGRDSKILNLKLTWNDAETSARLANLVAQTFIDRTRVLLHDDARNAFDYYSSQLENTRADARVASEAVMSFRRENGISNLDTETKVLLEEMSRLQSELSSRRAEADALRVASSQLETGITAEPEQVITYTIYRSPLKNRLAEYDWELRELKSKYTDQNPKVIKLKEQIETLNKMIADTNDEAVPENTYTRNTKREEMELRLQQLGDEIRMREAQAGALEQTLNDMYNKISVLSSKEKEYLMLQSRLEGILALENELSRRVDETRLVVQRRDASFDIVEHALVPSQPLPSGKKLLAVVALVFSVGCGLGLVLLLEFVDPNIRSLRDVKDIVGESNFLEIPAGAEGEARLIDRNQPISELAGLFRRLGNDMDATAGENRRQPLGIISLDPRSGRSEVAANLAITRSMKGQDVLLVDADLRSNAGPRPGQLLGIAPSDSGLCEHLLEGKPLKCSTDAGGRLTLVSACSNSGIADEQALLALASRDITQLISPIQDSKFALIDLPPLQNLEVAMELTGQLGRALMVIRSGSNRRDELRRCMAQLEKRGIECAGVILLDVPSERLETAPLIKTPQFGRVFRTRSVSSHV